MREIRINWNEIRKRMIDRNVDSMAQLAIDTGINKNTLSQKKSVFLSTTVNRIAQYLDCDPLDIVTSAEEAKHNGDTPTKRPNGTTDQALAEFNAGVRHPFTDTQAILGEPDGGAEGEPEASKSAWDFLKELAGSIDGPSDLAAEHDHYLYGTPRKGQP